ncbi:MAG: hypothetical protein K2Q12_01640 [Rickettsiales bacterium]|nr:hypothetical protein [Rickettsiales bacterium]
MKKISAATTLKEQFRTLCSAIAQGDETLATSILQRFPSLAEMRNDQAQTPLHLAVQHQRSVELVRTILQLVPPSLRQTFINQEQLYPMVDFEESSNAFQQAIFLKNQPVAMAILEATTPAHRSILCKHVLPDFTMEQLEKKDAFQLATAISGWLTKQDVVEQAGIASSQEL